MVVLIFWLFIIKLLLLYMFIIGILGFINLVVIVDGKLVFIEVSVLFKSRVFGWYVG